MGFSLFSLGIDEIFEAIFPELNTSEENAGLVFWLVGLLGGFFGWFVGGFLWLVGFAFFFEGGLYLKTFCVFLAS